MIRFEIHCDSISDCDKLQHRGRLKAKTAEALLFRTEHSCFLMHLEHACGPSFMM